MSIASVILFSYFLGGAFALWLFDIITKRIRAQLRSAAIQTQITMLEANTPLGGKASIILFVIVMWLFWPAVFIGALTDKKGDQNGESKEGTQGEGGGGVGAIESGDGADEEDGRKSDRQADPPPSES